MTAQREKIRALLVAEDRLRLSEWAQQEYAKARTLDGAILIRFRRACTAEKRNLLPRN